MKKVTMMFAALALLATACNKNTTDKGDNSNAPQLATPSNLDCGTPAGTYFTVTWDDVENADYYLCSLNDNTPKTCYDPQCSFDGLAYETEYTVKVVAVPATSDYRTSEAAVIKVKTASRGQVDSGIEEPQSFIDGSDFFVLALDDYSLTQIKSKVVFSFGENFADDAIAIWEYNNAGYGGTFDFNSPSGSDWRGKTSDWLSLNIGYNNWNWWGLGYLLADKEGLPLADKRTALAEKVHGNYDNYYLHLAMKANVQGDYFINLYGFNGNGNEANGRLRVTGNYDFARDGVWHEVEICLADFVKAGLSFEKGFGEIYFIVIEGGGDDKTTGETFTMPSTLDVAAIYLYKKN